MTLMKDREAWLEAMERYVGGHWQLEVPSAAGRYFTATSYGDAGDLISVYIAPDTGVPTPTKNWGGFWGSEPIPDLPCVPTDLLEIKSR